MVVALGYKGELVREFLRLAYPEREFEFVEVSPFEGPGSGLGLSLLACRARLQCPFVFCSCDTIVEGEIPAPLGNWMGYAEVSDAAEYRTVAVTADRVCGIREKRDPDRDGRAYIGLAGVQDFDRFWTGMLDTPADVVIAQGESCGLRALIAGGITARCFRWHDTGTPGSLAAARSALRLPDAPNILPKSNEDIWFVSGHVVKFSSDRRFIAGRVARSRSLQGFCPEVDGVGVNMYRYRKARGQVLSQIITRPLFSRLLDYAQTFWVPAEQTATEAAAFERVCMDFYCAKTSQRLEQFYRTFQRADAPLEVNGLAVPTCSELLGRLDWNWLCKGRAGRFHGDLHFENILFDAESGRFTFLDWRQDFGGLQEIGDIYYDLAKLNHGLIVCHDLISRDLFDVVETPGKVRFELLRKQSLVDCEAALQQFMVRNGYEPHRVQVLTALIYLNIAALHHYPYSLLLYYLGRWLLAQQLLGERFRT